MKKRYFYLILFYLFVYFRPILFAKPINSLNLIEVALKSSAPQILMGFQKPLYFEKSVDSKNMKLTLAFPEMEVKNFQHNNVVAEIKKLKGYIKDVNLSYSKVPSPRVILTIVFSQANILVRWNKLEDPNRLIFDLYKRDVLEKLKNSGNRLSYAKNSIKKKKLFSRNTSLKSLGLDKNNFKIFLDAGHGGNDFGAKGFSLREKDITLDIARRTRDLLQKVGFKVFLARNKDKDLSLLERSEFANQLEADLFLSIHVNAVKSSRKVSGIETYFLKSQDFLPPYRRGGFLFIKTKKDLLLAKLADFFLKRNLNLSKCLAFNIQNSVVNFIKSKNLSILSRGVKKENFRVLLRGGMPTALVEVGFLTDKQEAKNLKLASYRQILAEGICLGIKKYVYRFIKGNLC